MRWPVRRTGAPVVLAAVAVLVSTGCGIGADATPRELAVTTSTSSSIVPESEEGDVATVLYFVQGEKLVPLTRALPSRSEKEVLESLLVPPTPQEGVGLSSAIPAGTQLIEVFRDGRTLSVDLSEEFNDVVGPSRQKAVGQMVMSLTELDADLELTFSIDGEPAKVTTSRGDVSMVSACDFESMLADPADESSELTPGQGALIEQRRRDLARSCP